MVSSSILFQRGISIVEVGDTLMSAQLSGKITLKFQTKLIIRRHYWRTAADIASVLHKLIQDMRRS